MATGKYVVSRDMDNGRCHYLAKDGWTQFEEFAHRYSKPSAECTANGLNDLSSALHGRLVDRYKVVKLP